MQLEDTEGFKGMMRMDFKHFSEILNLTAPDITPQEITGRNKVISAAERWTVTLRFLVKYLDPLYLKVPPTEEEWLSIVERNTKLAGNTQTQLGLSAENMWPFEGHHMVARTIIITSTHTRSF